jgi:predicted lipid-binding transport protein (Tim44 family)
MTDHIAQNDNDDEDFDDADFVDELRTAIMAIAAKYGCTDCYECEAVRDYSQANPEFVLALHATRGEMGQSNFCTFQIEMALCAPADRAGGDRDH